MSVPYMDDEGRIVVREQAGGHGGGATSSTVRMATEEEMLAFHTTAVARAEAQVLEAKQALDAAKKAREVTVQTVASLPQPDREDDRAPTIGQPGQPAKSQPGASSEIPPRDLPPSPSVSPTLESVDEAKANMKADAKADAKVDTKK